MVATPTLEELQVTDWRTCVLLSLKVPVAMNCCVVPGDSVGLGGVTAIDTNPARGCNEKLRTASALLFPYLSIAVTLHVQGPTGAGAQIVYGRVVPIGAPLKPATLLPAGGSTSNS